MAPVRNGERRAAAGEAGAATFPEHAPVTGDGASAAGANGSSQGFRPPTFAAPASPAAARRSPYQPSAPHSLPLPTRDTVSGRALRGGVALALLALGQQGCISGHLLDAARRRERPVAYHDASIDGGRLLLAYSALVTDDLGRHPERTERRVALALTDLRRGDLAVEAFPVARLAADAPLGGERVALHPGADGRSAGPPPFLEIDVGPEGQHVRFVLHDTRGVPYPPFYSAALTRTRAAPWVYPLLPLSLAVDAATNPVLLFFAPAVMVLGD